MVYVKVYFLLCLYFSKSRFQQLLYMPNITATASSVLICKVDDSDMLFTFKQSFILLLRIQNCFLYDCRLFLFAATVNLDFSQKVNVLMKILLMEFFLFHFNHKLIFILFQTELVSIHNYSRYVLDYFTTQQWNQSKWNPAIHSQRQLADKKEEILQCIIYQIPLSGKDQQTQLISLIRIQHPPKLVIYRIFGLVFYIFPCFIFPTFFILYCMVLLHCLFFISIFFNYLFVLLEDEAKEKQQDKTSCRQISGFHFSCILQTRLFLQQLQQFHGIFHAIPKICEKAKKF